MQGTAVNQRWPHIRVTVNGKEIWNDCVTAQSVITARQRSSQSQCVVCVEYSGKTDQDTVVDSHGNIMANQCVRFDQIWCNGVDLVSTKLLYKNLVHYQMHLDAQKQTYFEQHGLPTHITHTNELYENGIWTLTLPMPVLTGLTQLHDYADPTERTDLTELKQQLLDVYHRL